MDTVIETEGDYSYTHNGHSYAGIHLLVDLWGCRHLTDIAEIEFIMRDAVAACGATLLNIDLHYFTPNNGVSGVAVLAESHMSIHTWPERDYAAMDIFVCGNVDPYRALAVLKSRFMPGRVEVKEELRGGMGQEY